MLRQDEDRLIRYNYLKIIVTVGIFTCGTRPQQAKQSEAKGP